VPAPPLKTKKRDSKSKRRKQRRTGKGQFAKRSRSDSEQIAQAPGNPAKSGAAGEPAGAAAAVGDTEEGEPAARRDSDRQHVRVEPPSPDSVTAARVVLKRRHRFRDTYTTTVVALVAAKTLQLPIKTLEPVKNPVVAAAERRGAWEARVKSVRAAYISRARGRPAGASGGREPAAGSLRALAASHTVSPSTVFNWVRRKQVARLPRGRPPRRVQQQLFPALLEFVRARQKIGALTVQKHLADSAWALEDALSLRPPGVAAEHEKLKQQRQATPSSLKPSQSTISRICKALGISSQKAQPRKKARYRATLQQEHRHWLENADRWGAANFLVADECMLTSTACARRTLAEVGQGAWLFGELRGPAFTLVYNRCCDP